MKGYRGMHEFISIMKELEETDELTKIVLTASGKLIKFYGKYKNVVAVDERQDLIHDLYLFAMDKAVDFNPNKGTQFSTYLETCFPDFQNIFNSKYLGITVSRRMRDKLKEENDGKPFQMFVDGYTNEITYKLMGGSNEEICND